MRLSLRVGLATALIIFTLALINRQLHSVGRDPQSFWHFDTTSFRAALRPQSGLSQDPLHRKWGSGTRHESGLSFRLTNIEVPNEGVLVMGKLRDEDTAWASAELAEWRNYIYTVDDTNAPTHTPKNKGREALPYLQYIVDHYDDLPAIIVFLHPHRDGWPAGWHTDTQDNSNVDSVRALQRDFVQEQGFVNLRCQLNPGCPEEIRPFRSPPKPGDTGEKHYAAAWKELFGNNNVPDTIAAPCCSQFAVSRDQVLKRPLSDYKRMYNWVLNNDLADTVTSNIMEYSWHIIFGQAPVFCPDTFQCYADVYGEEVFAI
ncbi:hypothetical protein N7478_011716 [Penicillium angulare]|uniref:uncharacterized protein n=1 Tax=Penicillium angulare TaxID=116970 RepID=UPI0025419461|nr:uncharacterized protein N7478_011716 [Penicillium angulare]KAJ5261121.1 hypothetical protein N7478_011716 [Penicillium angulare]